MALPESVSDTDVPSLGTLPPESLFKDLELPEALSRPGSIMAWCVADGFDLEKLKQKLKERGGRWIVDAAGEHTSHPDVLYGQYWQQGMPEAAGDVFYFEFGVLVLWGLPQHAENEILHKLLADCMVNPMPEPQKPGEEDVRERDELHFKYVTTEKATIQNDTVTINYRSAGDYKMKLSIAYALSQSTKLSVYEERILEIVKNTKDIPEELAENGEVHSVKRKNVAKLIGEVFLQKSEVNLLSTVLDTPEFFWRQSDRYEMLYRSAIEYLELEERVEVLNNRFKVLQEMLEIARSQQTVAHSAALDWVVIWLILIDVVLLVMQFIGSLALMHR